VYLINQLSPNLAYMHIHVIIATQNLGFVRSFTLLRLEKNLKDLPYFNPEEHTVVMEFSVAPTILELTHICTGKDDSNPELINTDICTREDDSKSSKQITCTLVGGDQVMLYLEPQEMSCLPDGEMSEGDFVADVPGIARYALVKVARKEGGEPKYWLVVCSKSRRGWLVFYGDFSDEDEGDFKFIHTQTSRVAVAPV
jgi:hypothetical protein